MFFWNPTLQIWTRLSYVHVVKFWSQSDHICKVRCHMNIAFIRGVAKETYEIFRLMITLVVPQVFDSWQLCHDMLCGWQMSYSQRIGFLGANLDEVRHPQSWRATWGHFGRLPPFHGASNMSTYRKSNIYIYIFFSFKSVWSSCAQPPPYPKGKKPTQTRHHIILALKFGSHIWAAHGTASQNVIPN